MLSNKFSMLLYNQLKTIQHCSCQRFIVSIALSFCLVSAVVAAPSSTGKYYLRLEHSKPSNEIDLEITSIGTIALEDNLIGHFDLSRLTTEKNGNGMTLNFGGGYVFNWDISLYALLGFSLGYNQDKENYIAAYFPEVGAILDITNKFGISVSTRRYLKLYDIDENIVMFGLVFRS